MGWNWKKPKDRPVHPPRIINISDRLFHLPPERFMGAEITISREKSDNELRAKFQSAFPFPPGVKWDGDFIHGSNEVIGSFRNATEWSAMWRGFRKAWELAQ